MVARYTINTNSYIEIFLWDDFFMSEGCCYRRAEVVPYYHNQPGRMARKNVMYGDDLQPYIMWNGKKVFLNNFDYVPVSELIEMIEKKEYISADTLLATLIRDKSSAIYSEVINSGVSFYGRRMLGLKDTQYIKSVPLNPKPYNTSVSFFPDDADIASYSSVKSYYVTDLVQLLRSGCVFLQKPADPEPKPQNNLISNLKRIFKKG